MHYSLHTAYGLAIDTAASVLGVPVKLTHMALGDGNGDDVVPGQQLVHELLRLPLNRVYIDPADPAGTYTIEVVVSSVEQALNVREFAVIDEAGGTYTHGSLPLTELTPLTANTQTSLTLLAKIIATNGATVELVAAGAVATQSWVDAQLTPERTTPGGTTNQVWTKASNAPGDCEWRDPSLATVVVDTIEEQQTLNAGQSIIDLVLTTTRGLALYIDGERLPESAWVADPAVASRLTLVTPVSGAGHTLIACQNEPTANTPTPLERAKNLSDLPSPTLARAALGDVLTRAEVQAMLNERYPIGMTSYWDGTSPPSGYLVRNGAEISRTTYAALFAQIGTRYGDGNGLTTFNLPDDRGLFEAGADLGRANSQGLSRSVGDQVAGQVGQISVSGVIFAAQDGSKRYIDLNRKTGPSTLHATGDNTTLSKTYNTGLLNYPDHRARLPVIRAY